MALWFGRLLGYFAFYLVPIRKKVALDNISKAFPENSESKVKSIARRTYVNFGQMIVEFFRMPKEPKRFLNKYVRFVGGDLLQKAQARGKGGICLSGHFGNWETMAASISARGYNIVAVAREQRNPLVNKLINQYRTSAGTYILPLGMAVRGVLKALKDNHFLIILADQDAHTEGIFVDFLGRPSSTAPGPALFALKTGAPLLFCNIVREKRGYHTVYFKEIDLSDLNGVTDRNLQILTQRYANTLEECIRKWPDHWFWMHRRWKTPPPLDYQSQGTDINQS